ncbi:MAG: 4-hydroxy-3-methylbut-2-enyl diphosphate reductase [Myxococcales bacterium]|jgi:4-hydroxy-3-methylbut-2-enyl diphosphate reductase|nr:4-hydroxy-3-methylbut-2-enyl diphosphate reductase [Myxococcales bacterium]
MEVITISPRGYCYGVVDAMTLVRRIAADPDTPRPIHVLGMLVHNRQVTEAFADIGVICLDKPGATRVELLDQVESGTVVFTAHGIAPEVRLKALARGLHVEDATCPDVAHTHGLIEKHVQNGGSVIYVGISGHPEPEGACGVAPGAVHLVSCLEEVASLPEFKCPVLVTNQTTMSQWDIKPIINAIKERFPSAWVQTEICLATQVRQEAVAEQAGKADLLVVVGDERSNNSRRLAEVGVEIVGVPVMQVASVADIDPSRLPVDGRVAVTSGASTPTAVTREVITYLKRYDGQQKPPEFSTAVGNRVLPSLPRKRRTGGSTS